MSNSLFTANGTKYPILEMINKDFTLNQTAYEANGPVYMGLQNVWDTFFSYAKLPWAFIWMTTFGASTLIATFNKHKQAQHDRKEAVKQTLASGRRLPSIYHQYTDRLNVLQRSCSEVPGWWFGALFLAGAGTILVLVGSGHLFIPIWTDFVGLATGIAVVVPLGYLYAVSNYQVAIGDFNELMYGYMIQTKAGLGNRHPCGLSVYGSIAGDVWYRAQ